MNYMNNFFSNLKKIFTAAPEVEDTPDLGTEPKENMERDGSNLNIQGQSDINILLLGETGVGKSTFINSVANYLQHKSFEQALEEPSLFLIPSRFHVVDDNFSINEVIIANETAKVGDSATQDVKSYVFPYQDRKTRVRLIDSPGMADPRGVKQDDINCENILRYISQLDVLHAICFLYKPNDARVTVTFKYCLKQILGRLAKSAADNIIFIFTNAKGTNYKPGETLPCLRRVVEEIKKSPPYVDIKVDKNVFCFDNEAFRYLAAIKQGIEFDSETKLDIAKCWQKSSAEACRLINYILGDEAKPPLPPHLAKTSTSINEVRRIINQLGQPLADISQLISDNLTILERRENDLKDDNQNLAQLKAKLYVPIINLKVTTLEKPVTVCTDDKCSEKVPIEGVKTWHYKQRCHDPCYLQNVPQEIVGTPMLNACAAMDQATQTCRVCGCPVSIHMHIYYITEKFDDKRVDPTIQKRIDRRGKALTEAKKIIKEIDVRKSELAIEKEEITRCAAKFACFLQQNAITPFNDAYQSYIKYLIFREESLGNEADGRAIFQFQKLLEMYDQIKSTFDNLTEDSAALREKIIELTPQNINDNLQKLYSLKHNGAKIKQLYEGQDNSRKQEYRKSEYVHPAIYELRIEEHPTPNSVRVPEKRNKKSPENSSRLKRIFSWRNEGSSNKSAHVNAK